MCSQLTPIQIDRGGLIHRTEVQQHTADVEPLRQCEYARIPKRLLRFQHAPHAGKLAFRRKRHEDIPRWLFRRFPFLCNGVLPHAVEVQVALAHHLRARIFRQDRVWVKRFAPCGFHALVLLFKRVTGIAVKSSTAAAARNIAGVGTFLTTPSSK